MTSLSERLDSFPEAWRPKNVGEKLIGELIDVDLRESDYGEPYAVLTVLAEEGSTQDGEMIAPGIELTWHAFHAMARNAVRKKQPQVGERVGIVYAGTGAAQPGRKPPERWRLVVERPQPELFDYSTISVGGDEPDAGEKLAQSEDDDGIPF
jgi:hypothetical protein